MASGNVVFMVMMRDARTDKTYPITGFRSLAGANRNRQVRELNEFNDSPRSFYVSEFALSD